MSESDEVLRARLNLETGQVAWASLQRFFAQGRTLLVSDELDLIEVAVQLIKDNDAQMKFWMDEGTVSPVPDDTARVWVTEDLYVWSVVVRPWVLVQTITR